MGTAELIASLGESVVDVDFQIPAEPLNYFTFDGTSLARKDQAVIDSINAIQNLNFDLFWGQVYGTLSADAADALTQFARGIELLWSYPNFPGIKPFLQSKVGKTYNSYVILQADVDLIIAAFTAQGVTLP